MKKYAIAAAGAILGLSATVSQAQTACGTPGSAADGGTECTADVLLAISNRAVIANLADIDFGTWDGTTIAAQSDDFCIGTNGGATANLDVTITSTYPSATNSFRMYGSTSTDFIEYGVAFSAPGTGSSIVTPPASPISGATWVVNSDVDLACGDDDFQISALPLMTGTDSVQAAGSDSYSDTVTVLVAPQ